MTERYQSRTERRRKQQSKNKKQPKIKKILKVIFLTMTIIILAGLVVGGTTFAIYAKDAPPLDEVLLFDPVASQLYDRHGNVFAVIGEEKRDYVEYNDIPKEVIEAVIATEDVRFFEHHGLDFRRLIAAVFANVTRGFGAEGASTITQQVVKLSFLTHEKTLKRKAQEAWLAFKLENNYTKEQIFEIYINKIYYANGIHGIETAAKYYFGKSLDELELHERAFLAGLPQSPNNYDPYVYPERADKRKNIVLSLMHHHGFITKEEMEAAQNISITETLIPKEKNNSIPYKYDSFVDQVIREVESMGDFNVYTDGLKIYTTLDPDAQEFTEKMFFSNEIVEFPNDEMQAGLVLLDTKTGEVLAIGGNRYRNIKRGRNYATQLNDRQPGSTVKPIFDYGPAIEYLNWSTYEQIVDEPYKYETGQPINNWDNRYLGQMSIREALYKSRNIPALKAFQAVGKERVRDFAAKVGLEYESIDNEAASIGGIENISPIKLAGAYAAFGNNGVYNKPHTVKKIVLRDDETVIENKIKPQLAMKDSTAYMITDMLKDVISNKPGATGRRAIIPGLPAAGKTGTTNYTKEDMERYGVKPGDVPDAWFVGYTTNFTIAVWTGYEKRSIPLRAGTGEQQIATYLYKHLMEHVSKNVETPDFQMPKSVVRVKVEKGTNPPKLPSEFTPKDMIVEELFIVGTEPKEVSTAFEKLDPPSVQAEYNQEDNQIIFSWEHPKTEEKELEFDVTIKISGGESIDVGLTKNTSYIVEEPLPETTYTIEVKAVSKNQESVAGTASVTTPKIEEEETPINEEEDQQDNDGQKDPSIPGDEELPNNEELPEDPNSGEEQIEEPTDEENPPNNSEVPNPNPEEPASEETNDTEANQ